VPQQVYDVLVVGSGASGGTLAGHLAGRGVDVAVIEGGPKIDTRTAFNTHAMPFDFPDRHIPTMRPGVAGFEGERSRCLGGKSMTWNAVTWRLSHRDFKGRSIDGAGEDWPIDYADLAPYYETIEREVGVCGNLDHLEDLPDGVFLPPVPMKCSDMIVRRGAAKLGVKVIHVRKATRSTASPARPACHFCGNCMAGCDVVIINGPVFAGAVDGSAFEIAVAQAPCHGVPGHAFAAEAAAAFRFETRNPRPHGRNVPVRKFEGHGMGVKSGARVDFWAAFDYGDVHASTSQVCRERATGRTRPDYQDVVRLFRHSYLS